MSAAVPCPAVDDVPVVDSFAVAAGIRITATGTRASLAVALPQDVEIPPDTLVRALLTLGQMVLDEHRLTDQLLPAVEVTAVEPVETVPATVAATGFTVGITNDLEAQHSTLVLDSDFSLGNDDGVLLAAATLIAGAEHLLDPHPAHRPRPGRKRWPSSRSRRRSGGRERGRR